MIFSLCIGELGSTVLKECTLPFTACNAVLLSPKEHKGSWVQLVRHLNDVTNTVTRDRQRQTDRQTDRLWQLCCLCPSPCVNSKAHLLEYRLFYKHCDYDRCDHSSNIDTTVNNWLACNNPIKLQNICCINIILVTCSEYFYDHR